MNFKYSPGLIGYGAKGSNGSDGLPGLAMYFTDRNPLTDFITIEDAIKNDEVLWATAVPGTKLPGGRSYSVGDLIIDPRGFVYVIDNKTTGNYSDTGMALNKSTFFEAKVPAVQTDNGFERWFNKGGVEKYIIDNIYTNVNGINYSASPSKIYGIAPKDFARIEYSNINDVSYNAFSIYSSGETVVVDDHKSISLVREIFSNSFRLGNIDGSLRDTDLFLDVSSLKHKKESGNRFHKNTVSGTILTNSEVSTNTLFSPVFSTSPASFTANSTSTTVRINWVISDFTADPSVKAILYFYKKQVPTGSYNVDDSFIRPLTFHINPEIDNTGQIIITNLIVDIQYEYYMAIVKNGWERTSIQKQITTTNTPIYLNVLAPNPPTLTADYLGTFVQNSNKVYTVSLDTNSYTGWRLTDVPKPSWVGTSKTGKPTSGPDTFDVSLSINSAPTARSGNITLSSEASDKIISITQNPLEILGEFTSEGRLVFTPALSDQTVAVSITTGAWVAAAGGALSERRMRIWVETWTKSSGGIWSKKTNVASGDISSKNSGRDPRYDPNSTGYNTVSNSFNISPNMDASIYIKSNWLQSNYWHPNDNPNQYILGPSCDYDDDRWVQSMGYAYISSISKVSGTGNVQAGTNRYYYWKKYFPTGSNTCDSVRGAGSTNTSHPSRFP